MSNNRLLQLLVNSLRCEIDFDQVRRDDWVRSRARYPRYRRGTRRWRRRRTLPHAFVHCRYFAVDLARYHDTSSGLQAEEWAFDGLDVVGEAAYLPVRDAAVDATLCTEALEHVAAPIRVLHELGRVTRPGGHVLCSAPLGSGLHQQPYHFY